MLTRSPIARRTPLKRTAFRRKAKPTGNLSVCPYYQDRNGGMCQSGCVTEPACVTCEPLGGWPPIRTRTVIRRTPLKSRVKPAVPPEVLKALAARSGGLCEAQLPGCLGRATDPCHRVGRAQGGGDALSGIWHGCRRCHEWCHARPAEAYDLGLMLRSWQVPELEPMAYRDQGWVLLGEEVVWL